MTPHNPRCFANHLGAWACEARFLQTAIAAIRAGTWQPQRVAMEDDDGEAAPPRMLGLATARPVYDADHRLLYWQTPEGLAIVELNGPLMKAASKYGGSSTVDARRAIRSAVDAPDVGGIMLHIDSPGGHVAGTMELADEVKAASAAKPTAAHIDDLGASAAYWVASAASRITVNAMGEVGSIGVYTVVYDTKGAADAAGVRAIVVGSGGMKGAFADGTEITPDQIAYLQGLVDNANAAFVGAVKKHRAMTDTKVKAAADGRVFPAAQAKELGLVDAVATYDKALAMLAKEAGKRGSTPRRDRMAALIDLEAAG